MTDLFDRAETTILIVDDNPIDIKMEQIILEKDGYRTAIAMDGAECIEMMGKTRPDLILIDISMPGMSGIEVCRILKSDEVNGDIPVIFVTANTDSEILKEAFESGGRDYVRKPVNRTEMLARINSALIEKRLTKKLLEEERLKGVLETAGAVCHELNQPMQAVSGICELLMMDMLEDNPLFSDIRKIKGQIDRMAKITMKLMGITRYETRRYIVNRKIIDIDKASEEPMTNNE